MRPRPALARWLADATAQARSGRRSAAAARRIGAPALARFAASLDELAKHSSSEARTRAVTMETRALLAGDWWQPLLAALIREARADPYFEPAYPSVDTPAQRGLVLLDHAMASVALLAMSARRDDADASEGSRVISFGGRATVTRVLSADRLDARRYEADDPGEDFGLATAAPCRFVARERVAAGEIVAADGRTQALAFAVYGHDALVIRAEVRAGGAALRRDYDAASGTLVGLGMVDEAPARTQLMLSLLRAMHRADAAPLFAEVIQKTPFFMRWYAMRELLALDPDAALPLLDRLADGDPHPEVRAAAAATRADLAVRYPALFALRPTAHAERALCPA